jgi:hypothetical protein
MANRPIAAPFGVLASEWMRDLPHVTHPRDMDKMVTSFRCALLLIAVLQHERDSKELDWSF